MHYSSISTNDNNIVKQSKDTQLSDIARLITTNVASPYPYPRVTPTNDLIYEDTDKYVPPTGIVIIDLIKP
jgi:hypothetical protein